MTDSTSRRSTSPSPGPKTVGEVNSHNRKPRTLLPLLPSRITSPAPTAAPQEAAASRLPETENPSECRPRGLGTDGTPPVRAPNLWAEDLQLMHHYTLVTCHTLPRGEEVLHIWQSEVVKLAFTHSPLLHQILAFSAFHMAYLNPDQRHQYFVLALQHQTEAARGLRTSLADLAAEHSEACFAAACFLIFGAFARLSLSSSGRDDSPRPMLADLINVFTFVRGMNIVLHESKGIMQQGRLVDLFKLPVYTNPVSSLEAMCEDLESLPSRIHRDDIQYDPAAVRIVDGEIFKLVRGTREAIRTSSTPELRAISVWPIVLSDEFLTLLQERHPLALIVVMYYCVIVRDSEASAWFTRNWGKSVAWDIKSLLSPSQMKLCEWAFHQICDVE